MNAAVLDAPAVTRAGPAFDMKWLAIGSAVALTTWLAPVPAGFMLWESFLTPETAERAATFTLHNYLDAYSSFETLRLLFNSVRFAVGASLFAFAIGAFFAWVNERTNTPFKTLFYALSIVPLI